MELDSRASFSGLNKAELLDLLVNRESDRGRRNTLVDNLIDPYTEDEVDPILLDVISSSFMKPLGETAKKYCCEGQLLEQPFLEQFESHCLDDSINTLGNELRGIDETPNGK